MNILIRIYTILFCLISISSCNQVSQQQLVLMSVSPQAVKVGGSDFFVIRFRADSDEPLKSQEFVIEFEDADDDYKFDEPAEFRAVPLGNDQFEVKVNGWLSGTRRLLITEQNSGLSLYLDLEFLAASPEKIQLINSSTPSELNNPLDEVNYELALLDRFGNIISDTSLYL